MSVETARLVLAQAQETEKRDFPAETARKRAVNAYTGASAFLPPEAIVTAARAVGEREQES